MSLSGSALASWTTSLGWTGGLCIRSNKEGSEGVLVATDSNGDQSGAGS